MAEQEESRATAYTTLAPGDDFRHELEIKRSRFITVLRRASDEDAARALVAELRKEFHDARHHCSAFVLGPDRVIQRSNDDGEPSGTAGIPMLEALIKRETLPGVADLSDVSAVVVRYFGGILLGAGGLVRAYSESISAALDSAPLVQRRRLRMCDIPCPTKRPGGWKTICAPRATSWPKLATSPRRQSCAWRYPMIQAQSRTPVSGWHP
ncbi:IMPACT family member YvyE [Arthrobacter sp. Hiyo8]|nr:IMPACT family member YvyE [Arthrobacter sp. Hiyo8]